jgi:hypothetical protein
MSDNIQKVDLGHWIFFKNFNPADWVGFIYRIIDLDTKQEYIGKKFFWKTIRKTIKNRKNKKRIIKPSNWKTYTGSCKSLNEQIALRGENRFKFIIESLHESRGTLHLAEVEKLIKENALREKLPDGITKKYYNGMINGIKFIPGNETEKEKEYKVK